MSVQVTKDGRTLRDSKDYTKFRKEVFSYQQGTCFAPNCERRCDLSVPLEYDNSFHLNHLNGRGGGKRDDVMFRADGQQMVRGDCGKCHRMFHGQQSRVQSQPQWSRK